MLPRVRGRELRVCRTPPAPCGRMWSSVCDTRRFCCVNCLCVCEALHASCLSPPLSHSRVVPFSRCSSCKCDCTRPLCVWSPVRAECLVVRGEIIYSSCPRYKSFCARGISGSPSFNLKQQDVVFILAHISQITLTSYYSHRLL